MYPLKFENIYFNKIWGGRDFELFRDNVPEGAIGESWDIACHKNGTSVVANGKFKGMKLSDLIQSHGNEVLGSIISNNWFPILIKLINAKESLSVQVHPDDDYGMSVEGEMGKTEIWYVVEAFEGANLVVGAKGECTKETLKDAIEKGELEKYMNRVKVQKGDVFFVKSGLIHAIGEGVIIAEIQQNSDTTYRVYDYDRGRELHLDKALDVIDFSLSGDRIIGVPTKFNGFEKTKLCMCKDFSLELYGIDGQIKEESNKERFYTFTCVEGNGVIKFDSGIEEIKKGESVLIPAHLGKYRIEGNLKLLKSYVPSLEEIEALI